MALKTSLEVKAADMGAAMVGRTEKEMGSFVMWSEVQSSEKMEDRVMVVRLDGGFLGGVMPDSFQRK